MAKLATMCRQKFLVLTDFKQRRFLIQRICNVSIFANFIGSTWLNYFIVFRKMLRWSNTMFKEIGLVVFQLS